MENNTQVRNVVLFVISDLVRNGLVGAPINGKWSFSGKAAGASDAGAREFASPEQLTAYLTDAYVRQIDATGTLRAAS